MVLTIIELILIWVIPFLAHGHITGSDIASCITIDIIIFLPLLVVNRLIYNMIIYPLLPYKEPEKQVEQPTLTLEDHSENIATAERHLKDIEEWQANNPSTGN